MNEWYVLIRILGALCVLGGFFLLGIYFCRGLDKQYEEYESLKLVLTNLLRNQHFLRQSFPELFADSALCLEKSNDGCSMVGTETKILGERLPQVAFDEAWDDYVQQLSQGMKMGEGLKNQLFRLGNSLQTMDKEGIELQIYGALELLQEEIRCQRKALKEKKKVSISCCVMVGLFAVILLI